MAQTDRTHDPKLGSWVASANGHPDFPIQNLPLGVFSPPGAAGRRAPAWRSATWSSTSPRRAPPVSSPARRRARPRPLRAATLNALFALGAGRARALRARLSRTARRGQHRAGEARALPAPGGADARCTCRRGSATTPTSTSASTTRPTSAGCSARTTRCCRTTSTCPSATTAAPRRWCPPARPIRRPNGPAQAARRGGAELRPLRATWTTNWSSGSGSGPRQRAGRADPDRRGGGAHRRLLPAERLVGARHPGLGVPAARAVPGQELRLHGQPLGRHAGGAGAVPRAPSRRARRAIRGRCPTCWTRPTRRLARSRSNWRCCC